MKKLILFILLIPTILSSQTINTWVPGGASNIKLSGRNAYLDTTKIDSLNLGDANVRIGGRLRLEGTLTIDNVQSGDTTFAILHDGTPFFTVDTSATKLSVALKTSEISGKDASFAITGSTTQTDNMFTTTSGTRKIERSFQTLGSFDVWRANNSGDDIGFQWNVGSGQDLVFTNAGRLGINDTAPANTLSMTGNNGNGVAEIVFHNDHATNDIQLQLEVTANGGGDAIMVNNLGGGDIAYGVHWRGSTSDNSSTDNQFIIANSSLDLTSNVRFVVNTGGHIGIDTALPRGGIDIDFEGLADSIAIFSNDIDKTTLDSTVAMQASGGWTWGVPTGGDKGAGTINAKAVYDDNTILTGDYVFEEEYMEAMNSIQEMEYFYKKNKHMPTMSSQAELTKMENMSLGQRLNEAIVTIENLAIYIVGLENRLSNLERLK